MRNNILDDDEWSLGDALIMRRCSFHTADSDLLSVELGDLKS